MSFFETPRFDETVSNGAIGGPHYSTNCVVTNTGDESRNSNWELPLHQYDVAHGLKTQDQLDALKGLFWNMSGRTHGFRYKDWSDYTVVESNSFLAFVVAPIYQLGKMYVFGPNASIRPIKKPVVGSVVIYMNEINVTADTTIDYTTGRVTWNSNIPTYGDILTWTGEFDVPVRFNTDIMQPTLDNYNLFTWGQIPLIELRNPGKEDTIIDRWYKSDVKTFLDTSSLVYSLYRVIAPAGMSGITVLATNVFSVGDKVVWDSGTFTGPTANTTYGAHAVVTSPDNYNVLIFGDHGGEIYLNSGSAILTLEGSSYGTWDSLHRCFWVSGTLSGLNAIWSISPEGVIRGPYYTPTIGKGPVAWNTITQSLWYFSKIDDGLHTAKMSEFVVDLTIADGTTLTVAQQVGVTFTVGPTYPAGYGYSLMATAGEKLVWNAYAKKFFIMDTSLASIHTVDGVPVTTGNVFGGGFKITTDPNSHNIWAVTAHLSTADQINIYDPVTETLVETITGLVATSGIAIGDSTAPGGVAYSEYYHSMFVGADWGIWKFDFAKVPLGTFLELRFPERIIMGAIGGAEFCTTVIDTNSGVELRTSEWTYPLHEYNVTHGLKTQAQLDELRALFWVSRGKLQGFRFKDWLDFQVNVNNCATIYISSGIYQMGKVYSAGSQIAVRKLLKIVAGTVKVYSNAVDVTANTHIDNNLGLIEFTTSPPTVDDIVTWTGEFDVPVRFDMDEMMPTIDSYSNFSWNQIILRELRTP